MPSPDRVRGGLTQRPIEGPKSWVHYVSVDSLEQTVARVGQLGGRVARSPTAVPKVAWYAVVAHPEGNIFALWQPDPDDGDGGDPLHPRPRRHRGQHLAGQGRAFTTAQQVEQMARLYEA